LTAVLAATAAAPAAAVPRKTRRESFAFFDMRAFSIARGVDASFPPAAAGGPPLPPPTNLAILGIFRVVALASRAQGERVRRRASPRVAGLGGHS
jgi:hypothetical protein